jgi:putative transposase
VPFVEQLAIPKKRVLRAIREHHLLVQPHRQLKATRTPSRSTPRPTTPQAWWGLDMTKVMVEGLGWVSSGLVLDWYTKKLGGYAAGMPCTARHGLKALDRAGNRQFPDGRRGQGVSLRRDNGGQPTALAFMQAGSTLGMPPAFTRDNHPQGHAETARVRRTLNAACLWRQEWTSPCALLRAREGWITDDHAHDRHAALGYQAPSPFERHD